MRRPTLYAGLALITALGMSGVTALPAHADSTAGLTNLASGDAPSPLQITTGSDGWIRYPSVLAKINLSPGSKGKAQTRTVKGSLKGGTCSFELSGTAAANGPELYLEETAYHPASCTFEVTTTPLTPGESQGLAAVGATSGGVSVESSSRASTPPQSTEWVAPSAAASPTLAAAASVTGHGQGQWWDPINIKIAHQTVNMGWNYYASPYTWKRNTYGFAAWLPTPTGVWIYDETYYKSGWTSKSGAKFTAAATMQNDSFLYWVLYTFGAGGWAACGFPSSPRANFNFNESITAAGWNFNYTLSDSKSGACTNLVHHGLNVGGGYA